MYVTLPFWLFLLAILAAYTLVSRNIQNVLLLAASYALYAYLEPRFVVLLVIATGLTYLVGTRVSRESDHSGRWLAVGVAINVAILALFKYSSFFLSTVGPALNQLGIVVDKGLLNLILPLGISFYTFRLLSYLFDQNKRRIPADTPFVDMALYIAFFPQIVSGPIERAATFLPALKIRRILTLQRFLDGAAYIVVGVVYKFVIADPLAAATDNSFNAIASLGSVEAFRTIILYSIRLYGDFAGYSAMAIGASIWFGLPAMDNFRQPYFARSVIDFWTRWHISLSSWFRDYFFFPVSRALISRFGNRRSFALQTFSLFLTMILTGIWHGANITFLIWGVLHGIYVSAERIISRYFTATSEQSLWQSRFTALCNIVITQALIAAAWVFFRAPSISDAVLFFQRLTVPSHSVPNFWWLGIITPLVIMIMFDSLQIWLKRPSEYWHLALRWRVAVLCLVIVTIIFFSGNSGGIFVYRGF